MRSILPYRDREQPPSLPHNLNGRLGFPRSKHEEVWISHRNSRIQPQVLKTMWFPLQRNMRPLPARVSREVPRSILKFEMLLGTLDATPKFPNIPVSLQGNTEIPGVSREVPCSVLKCETVFDTLMRQQKFPDTLGSLEVNTKGPGTTSSEPLLPSCSWQESRFPCFLWKGFPAFPLHLRMRPVSGGNSRLSMCEVPRAERRRSGRRQTAAAQAAGGVRGRAGSVRGGAREASGLGHLLPSAKLRETCEHQLSPPGSRLCHPNQETRRKKEKLFIMVNSTNVNWY